MTCWFTSDTHFGHARILELGRGRPFGSVAEMDEALIERWNRRVSRQDEVFHLGDFAFADHDAYLSRLNGQKRLIRGNHDHSNRVKKATLWQTVDKMLRIERSGIEIVLCHYAMRVWAGSGKGSLQFYGHSHGNLPGDNRSTDVGVDCWEFQPVCIGEIVQRLARQPYRIEPDHHGGGARHDFATVTMPERLAIEKGFA